MKLLSALFLLLACPAFGSSATANVGQSVTLNVTADGTAPLSYQWRKNGVDIAGANSASLAIPSAAASDAGVYSVAVSNQAGSTLSDNATIKVNIMSSVTITPLTTNYPAPVIISW